MSAAASHGPPRRAYFFHTRSARHRGRACQQHRVFDARQEPVAEGYLFRTFHPSPVTLSRGRDIVLQLRKSFPLTGKIDIRDAGTQALLAVATRGYRLFDAEERLLARYEDPVPFRERAKRELGAFALDLALGTEGSALGSRAPTELVLTHGGARLGTLRLGALPFFPDPPARREPSRAGRMLRRLLPAGLLGLWSEATGPLGWALELDAASSALGETLLLGFSMLSIELRNWSS